MTVPLDRRKYVSALLLDKLQVNLATTLSMIQSARFRLHGVEERESSRSRIFLIASECVVPSRTSEVITWFGFSVGKVVTKV